MQNVFKKIEQAVFEIAIDWEKISHKLLAWNSFLVLQTSSLICTS